MTRYTDSVDVAIMDQHHRRWRAHRMRPVIPSIPIEALQAAFCPRKPSCTPCRKTPHFTLLSPSHTPDLQRAIQGRADCHLPAARRIHYRHDASTRHECQCAASLAQGTSLGPAPVCLQYDACSCAQQGCSRCRTLRLITMPWSSMGAAAKTSCLPLCGWRSQDWQATELDARHCLRGKHKLLPRHYR